MDLATKTSYWIEDHLLYPHGGRVGRSVQLCPHETDFIEKALNPNVRIAALSMARANSKTTLCGYLAAATLIGPLAQRGSMSAIVAPSVSQAKLMFEDVLYHMEVYEPEKKAWFARLSSPQEVISKETRTTLRILSSEPRMAHGLRANYIFADEPAQWQDSFDRGERMWAALRTSLGKIPGAKIVVLGTRPARADHFFEKLLHSESPRVASVCYSAEAIDDWRKANPLAEHVNILNDVIADEYDDIKSSGDERTFLALRCNAGISDVIDGGPVVDIRDWEALETGDGSPYGSYVMGIDMGGNSAMSAAAAVWADGQCQTTALFGNGKSLRERDEEDRAGGAYLRAEKAGELGISMSAAPEAWELVERAIETWGLPAVVVSDSYRCDELKQTLRRYRIDSRTFANLEQHVWATQRFKAAVADGWLRPDGCKLIEYALPEARVVRNEQGLEKLARHIEAGRRATLRDDALASLILATAWARASVGTGVYTTMTVM